jgi:hypothetical protein
MDHAILLGKPFGNRPFQGLFRHIAGGAKHWGERAAKPWLPYILLMSER